VWWSPIALTSARPLPRTLAATLLILYAAATLIVTLHHEPWRDEAETWLVARDLPLSQTLTWTRAAGTPILWPALVVPFARAGAPYVAQSLLNWAIMMAAAALFLFRAPFTATTKALFLLSFYMAYQYAVIARTYALGILLLFCVVALHDRRHSWPIAYAIVVALLASANAHSGAAAFAVAAWFVFGLVRSRGRAAVRAWVAALIMFAGIAAAVVQLRTSGHFIPPNVISPPYWGAFVEATAGAFFPAFQSSLTTLAACGILVLIVTFIRRNGAALWLALLSFAGLAFIFTYLWIAGYRHYGLVLMTSIAALWLAAKPGEESRLSSIVAIALNVALASSIVLTVRFASADLTRNFSGSREMARFLEQHHRDDGELAAHPPAHCEAVLPYLSRRTLYYPALGETGSYLKWDRALRVAQATRAAVVAGRAAQHYGTRPWLFLTAQPLEAPETYGLKLLYATHEPLMEPRDAQQQANDERYWLYGSTHAAP
jgi:hypothetical protein